MNLVLLYVIIFAISFVLGFSSRIGSIFSKSFPKLKSDFSLKRLRYATILFLPYSYLFFILLMQKAGFSNPIGIFKNLSLFCKFWSHKGFAYVMELSLFLIQAPFRGLILKRNKLD